MNALTTYGLCLALTLHLLIMVYCSCTITVWVRFKITHLSRCAFDARSIGGSKQADAWKGKAQVAGMLPVLLRKRVRNWLRLHNGFMYLSVLGTVRWAGGRVPGQDSPGYLPDGRHAVQRRRVDTRRRAVLYPPCQRITIPTSVVTVETQFIASSCYEHPISNIAFTVPARTPPA